MTAEIVRHPKSVEVAQDAAPPEDDHEPGELEIETIVLLRMLKDEIGLRWMSLDLRLQLEKVEELLGERGTAPTF